MLKLRYIVEVIEALYHKNVYIPEEMKKYMDTMYRLIYTHHATQRAQERGIDLRKIDKYFKLEDKNVAEFEIDDITQKVTGIQVILEYDENSFIMFTLLPNLQNKTAVIKTIWKRSKTDKRPFNPDKYSKPVF